RGLGYKQGLIDRQLVVFDGKSLGRARDGFLESSLSKLEQANKNIYPKYFNALELLEEHAELIPFHKEFAINSKFKLLHREEVVGKINKADKVQLDPKKFFLKESLGEIIGIENVSI